MFAAPYYGDGTSFYSWPSMDMFVPDQLNVPVTKRQKLSIRDSSWAPASSTTIFMTTVPETTCRASRKVNNAASKAPTTPLFMVNQPSRTPAVAPKSRRVRTGCLTCRERHLKCDEASPVCLNCTRSHRECKRGLKLNFLDIRVEKPPVIPLSETWQIDFYDESRLIASEYRGGLGRYGLSEDEFSPPRHPRDELESETGTAHKRTPKKPTPILGLNTFVLPSTSAVTTKTHRNIAALSVASDVNESDPPRSPQQANPAESGTSRAQETAIPGVIGGQDDLFSRPDSVQEVQDFTTGITQDTEVSPACSIQGATYFKPCSAGDATSFGTRTVPCDAHSNTVIVPPAAVSQASSVHETSPYRTLSDRANSVSKAGSDHSFTIFSDCSMRDVAAPTVNSIYAATIPDNGNFRCPVEFMASSIDGQATSAMSTGVSMSFGAMSSSSDQALSTSIVPTTPEDVLNLSHAFMALGKQATSVHSLPGYSASSWQIDMNQDAVPLIEHVQLPIGPGGEKLDVTLPVREQYFLQTFNEKVSPWVAVLGTDNRFIEELCHRSTSSPMLLNAVLAGGAKQLALLHPEDASLQSSASAYYNTASSLVLRSLQNPDHDMAETTTAASVLTAYELMSGMPPQRMAHTRGARALTQEYQWNSHSKNIGAACFWLSRGLEVFDCLVRNVSISLDPAHWGMGTSLGFPRRPDLMHQDNICMRRIIVTLAKIANYRASIPLFQQTCPLDEHLRQEQRSIEWDQLFELCRKWNTTIPKSMRISGYEIEPSTSGAFPTLVSPRRAAVLSRLMYHTAICFLSQIHPLLSQHHTSLVEMANYHARQVCGLVAHNKDDGLVSISIRCLIFASTGLSHAVDQRRARGVLKSIVGTSGWKLNKLLADLEQAWNHSKDLRNRLVTSHGIPIPEATCTLRKLAKKGGMHAPIPHTIRHFNWHHLNKSIYGPTFVDLMQMQSSPIHSGVDDNFSTVPSHPMVFM